MPDQAMRARVERLLRGSVREDDITRLFLFARDRCDGRESVQEIGDFVAHHSEREKGAVTRTVKDWVTIVQFRSWSDADVMDPRRLPSSFPEFIYAQSRRLDPHIIKKFTGMTRYEVSECLPSIISRLHKNADGTCSLSPHHTKKERLVIQCFISHLVAREAFNGERLFSDLTATLRSNELLQKGEVQRWSDNRKFVILFAAVQMHLCTVAASETKSFQMYAFAHPEGTIQVDCAVPSLIKMPNIPIVNLSSAIFNTGNDTPSVATRYATHRSAFRLQMSLKAKLASVSFPARRPIASTR